jgi:hypothetical protein
VKRFIIITLLSVIITTSYGQESGNPASLNSLSRTTIGINGASKTFKTKKGIYIVRQSIGQSSVIGTHKNDNGYTIRQGFQQPFLTAKIIPPVDNNSFSAKLFPNPFTESLHISFDITIREDLYVYIYNVSGNLVYSKEYPPTQLLSINLGYLTGGRYVLKVITEKKQFISNLIKH